MGTEATDPPELPGLSLREWLELTGMTAAAFSRLVPCSIAYPGMVARGYCRPSYEMACRIEQLTDGAVPRTRWYPPTDDEKKPESQDLEL